MQFNSLEFFGFFAAVCGMLLLTQWKAITKRVSEGRINWVRQVIVLLSSYYFYGRWNWKCLFLMIGLSLSAHYFSLLLHKTGKKVFFALGVGFPLIILGFFKYFGFFVDSFCGLFGIQAAGTLNILLPVGISFYTFQSLSYVIDVYRGQVPVERSLLKTALYISYFPQLVAGPIVKARDFIHQLYEPKRLTLKNFESGIQYFLFGLFKKAVIADNLSVAVDAVFANPNAYHGVSILAAVVAYSLQVYCDFSGYSDMAIGCARCMGYELKRNFDIPYIARNISEFWKRWHISLSNWLQEYLYIPLGGNRRGAVRTYINLFLTMLIGGLWHGASWTFVIWGAIHGLGLAAHKLCMKLTGRGRDYKGTLPGTLAGILSTYLFVCFCWVFFRAEDFTVAFAVLYRVFTWQPGVVYISSWTVLSVVLVAAATLAAVWKCRGQNQVHGFYPQLPLGSFWGLLAVLLAAGVTLGLAYTGNNPFIYFQF